MLTRNRIWVKALNIKKRKKMTRKSSLLILGMVFGVLMLIDLPYQYIWQIYVIFGFFLLYEGVLGIKLLYSFDTTHLEQYSKNHPSLKTVINLLNLRVRK